MPLVERIGGAVDLAYALGWGCIHALDMADVTGTAEMVTSLAAIAEDSTNPTLRWLAAVYHCVHIQAVGTGHDVEITATEALARGEEANEPDAFLWYAPQLLTARIMQGRVAEVMEVVRQGAANPGLPIWQPVFARMLLYVGEVDEATEVTRQLLAVDDPVPYDGMWLLAHMFLGEVVSLIGTPDEAAQQYRRLSPFAGRLGCIGTAVHHSADTGTRDTGSTRG